MFGSGASKIFNRGNFLCSMAMTLQGEGHKCSQVDVGKYKLIFCLPRYCIPEV